MDYTCSSSEASDANIIDKPQGAKRKKKKLLTLGEKPQKELVEPVVTAGRLNASNTVLGVAGIKKAAKPAKNDNSVISELAGVPKQAPKRKRNSRKSGSESEGGAPSKKGKLSAGDETMDKYNKLSKKGQRRSRDISDSREAVGNDEGNMSKDTDTEKGTKQKDIPRDSNAAFTEIKKRNAKKSLNNVENDFLLDDFESDYDKTVYITSQQSGRQTSASSDSGLENVKQRKSVGKGRRKSSVPSSCAETTAELTYDGQVTVLSKSNTENPTAHVKAGRLSKSRKSAAKELPMSTNADSSAKESTCVPDTPLKRKRRSALISPLADFVMLSDSSVEDFNVTKTVGETPGVTAAPKPRGGRRKSVAACSATDTDVLGNDPTLAGITDKQPARVKVNRRKSIAVSTPVKMAKQAEPHEVTTNSIDSGKAVMKAKSRRKSVVRFEESLGSTTESIDTTTDEDSTQVKPAATKSKTYRRRSALVQPNVKEPPSLETSSINAVQTDNTKISEPRVTRRRSAALVPAPVVPQNNDDVPNEKSLPRSTAEKIELDKSKPAKSARRKSMKSNVEANSSEKSFVSEDVSNLEFNPTKGKSVDSKKSRRRSAPVTTAQVNKKQSEQEGLGSNKSGPSESTIQAGMPVKGKSRRRSSALHVSELETVSESQPVDVSGKDIGTPVILSTPLNRRKSMRVMAITNSMQRSGTPLRFRPDDLPGPSTISASNEEDVQSPNEPQNKCPADFDSSVEGSALDLAKRKKKKVLTSNSQGSQNSKKTAPSKQQQKQSVTSDSGLSEIDTTAMSSTSLLSSATKSRKSIDEFRKETYNISTQKKKARFKAKLSDIDSSEESSASHGPSTSTGAGSRVRKQLVKKTAPTRGRQGSVSALASDINTNSGEESGGASERTNKGGRKKSAESTTCSSASESEGGTKRRKRSSGSNRQPRFPHSLVTTSLHSE